MVVLSGNRLEEFDFETSTKQQVKGNIYLAKVTRVEPSLQAAFVDYGGNRHGFLAFSEIHPDYYRIPIGDREAIDDEPVGDAAEPREAAPEEAGVSLAAALPEPVAVDPLPTLRCRCAGRSHCRGPSSSIDCRCENRGPPTGRCAQCGAATQARDD